MIIPDGIIAESLHKSRSDLFLWFQKFMLTAMQLQGDKRIIEFLSRQSRHYLNFFSLQMWYIQLCNQIAIVSFVPFSGRDCWSDLTSLTRVFLQLQLFKIGSSKFFVLPSKNTLNNQPRDKWTGSDRYFRNYFLPVIRWFDYPFPPSIGPISLTWKRKTMVDQFHKHHEHRA